MHQTGRLSYDGAVDADGHILEPSDLWETLPRAEVPRSSAARREGRERARRARDRRQALDDGPSRLPVHAGVDGPHGSRADGPRSRGHLRQPRRVRLDRRERAAQAARRRAHRRRGDLHDDRPALGGRARRRRAVAGLHACVQPLDLRMVLRQRRPAVPAAHLSLVRSRPPPPKSWSGPSATAPAACYVAPFTHTAKPLGHPDHDVVFAAAQDLDVPFAIHPTFEPQWTKGSRMGAWENVRELRLTASVQASDGVRHQFSTLFDYGVFDKFPQPEDPRARVGRRLDRLLARSHGRRVRPHRASASGCRSRTRRPTTSRSAAGSAATPTSGRSLRSPSGSATTGSCGRRDFPHADHTPEYIHDLDVLAGMFPDKSRRKFLGDNCRKLFKIDVTADGQSALRLPRTGRHHRHGRQRACCPTIPTARSTLLSWNLHLALRPFPDRRARRAAAAPTSCTSRPRLRDDSSRRAGHRRAVVGRRPRRPGRARGRAASTRTGRART